MNNPNDEILSTISKEPFGLRGKDSGNAKRFIFDAFGGFGSFQTKTFVSTLGLNLDGWIFGGGYDRASWLDPLTNTGKYVESVFFDGCAAISANTEWLSVQPCYRYGMGRGAYKARNAYNQIEERFLQRNVGKFFGRFILIIPLFDEKKLAIEGLSGYSEDPFLYGAFMQATVRTPFLGLSIGAESYSGQRNSVIVGTSFGLVDVK